MNLIEIRNLTKYYGKFKALDDVNLTLSEGRIIGLLGKNGAGKSTLMRCMLGFLKYDGDVIVAGKPMQQYREEIHNYIGFIPDVSCLDNRLTVQQTISYVSKINSNWNQQKATELLAKSELPLKNKVSELSKGMKTKLYLMITLSLDVKILLLDEPTLGLDIVFRKEFFNTILGEFYDESKTILISTHQVEEVEQILQDIIFINKGRVVLSEDIEQFKSQYAIYSVNADKIDELEKHNPRLINRTLGKVNAILPAGLKIETASQCKPSLSDLFMDKVGGSNE